MSILLVGGGGQCRSALPIIASVFGREEIEGIVDGANLLGTECFGIPFKYVDDQIEGLKDRQFVITIGQTPVNNPTGRRRMFERLDALRVDLPAVQSKCAIVHGAVARGSFIHDMAYVGPGAEIGSGTIINTGAIVEHDVKVGAHCHICPAATVIGGITICDDVIIGAGSVVVADITQPGFYGGVPARPIMLSGPQIIKPEFKLV